MIVRVKEENAYHQLLSVRMKTLMMGPFPELSIVNKGRLSSAVLPAIKIRLDRMFNKKGINISATKLVIIILSALLALAFIYSMWKLKGKFTP